MKPGAITRPAASIVRAADHPDEFADGEDAPLPHGDVRAPGRLQRPVMHLTVADEHLRLARRPRACVAWTRRAHGTPAASVDTPVPRRKCRRFTSGLYGARVASAAVRRARWPNCRWASCVSLCETISRRNDIHHPARRPRMFEPKLWKAEAHGPELPGGCICRGPGGGRAAQWRMARRSARPGSGGDRQTLTWIGMSLIGIGVGILLDTGADGA